MENLILAFKNIFNWDVLLIIGIGSTYGIFCGAMPGISATLAVALMVPVTFYLPPVAAFAALASTVAMAIFAGDIPAALVPIPGTPSSAAYTNDSYELTKQGKGELVLGVDLVTSAIGGLIGAVILMLAAPALAEVALTFFFILVIFGVTSKKATKGFEGVTIGFTLFIVHLVGIPVTASPPTRARVLAPHR